jgi:molecular chaperone GrpE
MKKEKTEDVNMAEVADNPSVTQADELATLKDDYLRLQAEFDNYRKRTAREKMDILLAGGEDVIKALLPVLDDSERALSAMVESPDRQGVELVFKKLRDTLAAQGLAEIEAMGGDMDTDLHEAVARIPAPEQKGKVVDVVQKGYKLRDKVVRHAKCVVGE